MRVHCAPLLLVAALPVVFAVHPAVAATPTEALRKHVDRIVAILRDPALASRPDARRHALGTIADGIFDFEDSARRSLGSHWQARTPAERREFVRLYTDLIYRSYIQKIEQYNGEPIEYVGEKNEGDRATVGTVILTKRGTRIPVDYRLHMRDGRWRVYDVVIEGVSLVANYRTQFNKIIRTNSYRELVGRLRAKSEPGI